MIVDYSTPCPDCAKAGLVGFLSLNTDTGKITCRDEFNNPRTKPHVYETLAEAEAILDQMTAPATAGTTDKLPTAPAPPPSAGQVETEPQPATEERKPQLAVETVEPQASGDVRLVVVVPEWLAAAMQAEAELQECSLEVYWKRWLDERLESYWGLMPAAK